MELSFLLYFFSGNNSNYSDTIIQTIIQTSPNMSVTEWLLPSPKWKRYKLLFSEQVHVLIIKSFCFEISKTIWILRITVGGKKLCWLARKMTKMEGFLFAQDYAFLLLVLKKGLQTILQYISDSPFKWSIDKICYILTKWDLIFGLIWWLIFCTTIVRWL